MRIKKLGMCLLLSAVATACEVEDLTVSDFLNDLTVHHGGDNDADIDADADADADGDTDADTDTDSDPMCAPYSNNITWSDDGWVSGECNAARIQGPWFAFTDSGGSVIEMEISSQNEICVRGETARLENEDWATYWGAGFGLNLCENSATEDPAYALFNKLTCPRNLTTLQGFSFVISGYSEKEVRVGFTETGRNEPTYITTQPTGYLQDYYFLDATVAYNPDAPPIDPNQVESMIILIATDSNGPGKFDFCISHIQAVSWIEVP